MPVEADGQRLASVLNRYRVRSLSHLGASRRQDQPRGSQLQGHSRIREQHDSAQHLDHAARHCHASRLSLRNDLRVVREGAVHQPSHKGQPCPLVGNGVLVEGELTRGAGIFCQQLPQLGHSLAAHNDGGGLDRRELLQPCQAQSVAIRSHQRQPALKEVEQNPVQVVAGGVRGHGMDHSIQTCTQGMPINWAILKPLRLGNGRIIIRSHACQTEGCSTAGHFQPVVGAHLEPRRGLGQRLGHIVQSLGRDHQSAFLLHLAGMRGDGADLKVRGPHRDAPAGRRVLSLQMNAGQDGHTALGLNDALHSVQGRAEFGSADRDVH